MGDLIPLADYVAAREALAEQLRHTCPDCPYRTGCEEAGECLWGDADPFAGRDRRSPEPDLNLRLVEPPDIIA